MFRFHWSSVLLLLLLGGCSLRTPPTSFYTLSAETIPSGQHLEVSVGVSLVAFPEALDRPQIMLRSSENRMQIQELHHWAGPLDQQLLHVLTENLVRLTGSSGMVSAPWPADCAPQLRLGVAVLQFDGTPGGSVRLRVRWTLSDASGKLLHRQTSTLQEEAGAGIEALVAAQSRLLSRLAAEMAPLILTFS